jgi:hypothetical protein
MQDATAPLRYLAALVFLQWLLLISTLAAVIFQEFFFKSLLSSVLLLQHMSSGCLFLN